MSPEVERIRDQLRRAVLGEAWHGPSVLEAADRVRDEDAFVRMPPGGHHACELVLHIASWLEIVRERLEGRRVAFDPRRDWPPAGEPGASGWHAAKERVRTAYEALDRTLAGLAEADLERVVPEKGYTFWFMAHGTVQHCTYHAGQIVLFSRLLEERG